MIRMRYFTIMQHWNKTSGDKYELGNFIFVFYAAFYWFYSRDDFEFYFDTREFSYAVFIQKTSTDQKTK